MPAMINAPEAVARFRNQLVELTEHLREQMRRTDAAMEEAAAEWDDPQFKKYQAEFRQDREVFDPLCDNIEEFEQGPLFRLQQILEEYGNL